MKRFFQIGAAIHLVLAIICIIRGDVSGMRYSSVVALLLLIYAEDFEEGEK